ncbi:unnamed protein product [Anisakis simplex]|uniref:Uncharacterized protein n=1 Tax=Anisakis simplex TaxID=6269 RepID=A0A0M3KKD4_ANISI|nr:unnamed protein product [Anisakis simplex]
MAYTKRSDLARASGPHKVRRSPDWSLQLDSMKSESLVIVDQNATVNTFPGLVHTARHTMGVGCKRTTKRTRWMPWQSEAMKGVLICDKRRRGDMNL